MKVFQLIKLLQNVDEGATVIIDGTGAHADEYFALHQVVDEDNGAYVALIPGPAITPPAEEATLLASTPRSGE